MKNKIISAAILSAIMSASSFAAVSQNSVSLSWTGNVPAAQSTGNWKIVDGVGSELSAGASDLTITRDGSGLKIVGDAIAMSALVTTGSFDSADLNVWLASSDISGNTKDAGISDPVVTYTVGGKQLTSDNMGLSNKQTITVSTAADSISADLTTTVKSDLTAEQFEDTDTGITITGSIMVEASVG